MCTKIKTIIKIIYKSNVDKKLRKNMKKVLTNMEFFYIIKTTKKEKKERERNFPMKERTKRKI